MSFIIKINGKEVKDQLIEWKFKTHPTHYKSQPDMLKLNIEFWRNKANLSKDEEIEILNGDVEIEVPQKIKAQDYVNNHSNLNDEPINQSNISESNAQSDIPQSPKDSINTSKRKSGKKASDL